MINWKNDFVYLAAHWSTVCFTGDEFSHLRPTFPITCKRSFVVFTARPTRVASLAGGIIKFSSGFRDTSVGLWCAWTLWQNGQLARGVKLKCSITRVVLANLVFCLSLVKTFYKCESILIFLSICGNTRMLTQLVCVLSQGVKRKPLRFNTLGNAFHRPACPQEIFPSSGNFKKLWNWMLFLYVEVIKLL